MCSSNFVKNILINTKYVFKFNFPKCLTIFDPEAPLKLDQLRSHNRSNSIKLDQIGLKWIK